MFFPPFGLFHSLSLASTYSLYVKLFTIKNGNITTANGHMDRIPISNKYYRPPRSARFHFTDLNSASLRSLKKHQLLFSEPDVTADMTHSLQLLRTLTTPHCSSAVFGIDNCTGWLSRGCAHREASYTFSLVSQAQEFISSTSNAGTI